MDLWLRMLVFLRLFIFYIVDKTTYEQILTFASKTFSKIFILKGLLELLVQLPLRALYQIRAIIWLITLLFANFNPLSTGKFTLFGIIWFRASRILHGLTMVGYFIKSCSMINTWYQKSDGNLRWSDFYKTAHLLNIWELSFVCVTVSRGTRFYQIYIWHLATPQTSYKRP